MFMSFKTSKTSDPHRLLLNLSAKIDLKRSDKYVALSNISIYCKLLNYKLQDSRVLYKFATSK